MPSCKGSLGCLDLDVFAPYIEPPRLQIQACWTWSTAHPGSDQPKVHLTVNVLNNTSNSTWQRKNIELPNHFCCGFVLGIPHQPLSIPLNISQSDGFDCARTNTASRNSSHSPNILFSASYTHIETYVLYKHTLHTHAFTARGINKNTHQYNITYTHV